MALVKGQCVSKIHRDRRFEDYRSLKQYYRNSNCEEFIVRGYNTSTATAAELKPDGTQALTALGAEALGYIKSEADLASLDGDSVYVTYLDDDGVVYGPYESFLDAATSTDTEVPIGNEGVQDVVAAVDGTSVTITALNPGDTTSYVGKYMVVYAGDQKGTASLISAHTADNPTVLTVADSQNANLAGDSISVQTYDTTNFYRLRKMTCETEAPTDNRILLVDDDGDVFYGQLSDGSTEAAVIRYFAPAITTGQNSKYYLGYIKAFAMNHALTGDDEELGYEVKVTYTPKQMDTNVPVADETLIIPFNAELKIDLCLELQPATDCIIYISKKLDANHENVYLEYCFLEVDRLSN